MPPSTSSSPTKIRRITESILADISAGRLRSGDRITSERKLAENYKVSLGTAQRALHALEYRGVLTREHGRGTFVRGLGASVDARYVRFRDDTDRNLPAYWHILRHSRVRPNRHFARFFGGRIDLVRIDRRIDVDGRFVFLSEFFLPEANFKVLFETARLKDDTNLRELISQRLALPTLRVEQRVGFERASCSTSRILKCSPGRLCFTMELRGYTTHDRPIYLQRVHGEPYEGATLLVDTNS